MLRLTTLAGAATALWVFAVWIGAFRAEPSVKPEPGYVSTSFAVSTGAVRARSGLLKPAVRRLAPGVMARS